MLGPISGGYFVDLIGFDMATFWIVVLFIMTVSLTFIISFAI